MHILAAIVRQLGIEQLMLQRRYPFAQAADYMIGDRNVTLTLSYSNCREIYYNRGNAIFVTKICFNFETGR